jgi:ppGpp synthetase/RelA/SpoT-type nucleotidyltranferase
MSTNPAFTDCTAAKSLSPEQWVALHVPRFALAAPAFGEYKTFLETALKEARCTLAPMAVVEARPKGIPSFAEKILRKREFYQDPKDPQPPDPLIRMTDLCGGRVICQTNEEVHAVCQFIEKAFVIDWANSEDVSKRLKTTEFGYRSVHYIVQVDPIKLQAAGIATPVPPAVLGFAAEVLGPHAAGLPLKAEIQVRTLLEQASSGLGHDTLYKTELTVPGPVQREYAALAAVLEGADREIARLLTLFGNFKSNFGAWHDRTEVEKEIAYGRVLLSLPDADLPVPDKIPVAVRAAQLALAMGEHKQAIEILDAFKTQPHASVHRVLGQALVESHWQNYSEDDFELGQHHLEKAGELAPNDAEALGLLAECAAHRDDDEEARRLFALAVKADATEPITIIHYLEFEAARVGNDNLLRMASPMIRAALSRAQHQIESRSNLASAWSAVAMAHLFLGEPFPALHALAQLIRLCTGAFTETGEPTHHRCPCATGRALLRLRETVRHLRGIRERLLGFDWFERFLLLALAARMNNRPARHELEGLASWQQGEGKGNSPHFKAGQKTIFLAGGCEPVLQPLMEAFGKDLLLACRPLSFVLISGGTRSGISGVAGDVAAASGGLIQAFGYLPGFPPFGSHEDTERFPHRSHSPGQDFTPLNPLQAWTDLVAAGVAPARVKVLCYAPGDIARAECAIALALGARVGLVLDASLPKERLFDTAPWGDCHRLLPLPKDPMTLRAFLQIDHQPITKEEMDQYEPAARRAHEDYVKSATPKDPALKPWADLDLSLKLSNYHQVLFWQQALRDYGLGLRSITEEDKRHQPLIMKEVLPKVGDKDPIVELAQLEHGRWNVERLSYGWRYAKTKDIMKKLNPCLVSWPELVDVNGMNFQPWDIDAVSGLPEKFRQVGLELYAL